MEKIKRNRPLVIGLIVLAAIILISLLVGIGIHNRDVRRQNSAAHKAKVQYVLVNEDNGAKFNNKHYNLGKDFLKLVSQDKKHDWETATYDGAQDGMKNGLYDVEVIIPQDFSQRILSLESTSPKKAGVRYRVRKGQNEVTNQMIGRNVNQLIYDFNNRVVRMYFSSLIGNLRNAQLAMGNIANKQDMQVSDLANQVQQPFNGLDDQFGALFNTASILDENGSTDSQAFSNSMKDMLNALDKNKDADSREDSQSIKDLQDRLNSQLDTYNNLNRQSDKYRNDLKAYFGPENPIAKLKKYSFDAKTPTKTDDSFNSQITDLDEKYDSLLKKKKDLEEEYHLQPGKTEENITQIMNQSLNKNPQTNASALQNFINSLNGEISELEIAQDMTTDSKDTQNQINQNDYNLAVDILKKYSHTVGANYGSHQTTFINKNSQSNFDGNVTLGLTPGTNKIELDGKGISANGVDAESIKKQLEQEDFVVDKISSFDDNSMEIKIHPKETKTEVTTKEDKEKKNPDKATDSSENKEDKKEESDQEEKKTEITSTAGNAFITFGVTYHYKKPTTYKWTVNGQEQNTGDIQKLNDDRMDALNANVTATIAAAKQVVATYGNGESMADFASHQTGDQIVASAGSLADLASKDPTQPVPTDNSKIQQEAKDLADNYDKICQQLETLGQASGNLPVDKQTNSDIKALNEISKNLGKDGLKAYLDNMSNIIEWYNKAQELVNSEDEKQTNNENEQPKAVASDETDSSTEKQTNDDLVNQYNDLQKSINDSVKSLDYGNKDKQKDLKPVIKDLTNNTTKLQNSTNSIKNKLSQNVKDSQNQANNNQDFAQAFNNVMSNARNGEADNSKVYNFLTNPIKATGSYSELRQQSIIPYFMTLIGTLAALFVGLGIAKNLPGRKLTEETAMIDHTRPWLNLPSALITLGISFVIGVFFSLTTMGVVPATSHFDWGFYPTIIMVIMISAIAAGARHHRMVTIYVVSFLLALYILLTPFIGVLVRSGSLIQFLYRISPLQNIEIGYTVLINHGVIGGLTLFGLIIFLIVVIFANFFIKPLPTIEESPKAGNEHEA
ncbi:type VII secretion protein EsaA [Lactobacillus sp. PV034]|uniref:type VII secretion protein EsaA n=1 Tax=Lactobacillus sp. PV034 TaxID=2594495 RepID=UPI00224075CB|nr:type VII secretion protein EsaA [Lactobacillus sp. PV034]QNQ80159.1 type VII secretion protein EsaA [Lactobacillus sp. PV034]